ncbi:hypothetical protein KC345_g7437 [Hortaea werneckii]|nr:hypothetical protein KC345_g7437 [Hortaea werneckii]
MGNGGAHSQIQWSYILTSALVYGSAIWNLYSALHMKYGLSPWVPTRCSSNAQEEGEWTFGNILAVGMLVALVLPAFDIQSNSSPVNVTAEGVPLRPAFEQQGSDVLTPLSPLASTDALPSPFAEHSPRVQQTLQAGTLTLPSPMRVAGSTSVEDGRRAGINPIRRQATLEAEAGQATP